MLAYHRRLTLTAFVASVVSAAMVQSVVCAGLASASPPLIAGGGSKRTDCIAQFFSPQATAESFTRRRLRCADGGSCDADGRADDRCTFSIGVCLNFPDPERPGCQPSDVAEFEVRQSATDPDLAALQAAVGSVGLPTAGTACSAMVGVAVPVRVTRTGKALGKKGVRALTRTAAGITDTDRIVLVCDPSGPSSANGPPTVRAVATPTRGKVPLRVAFSASASDPDRDALSIRWDFGDGATAAGAAASHTYEAAGSFEASVTATDEKGATATTAFTVVVEDRLAIQHTSRYPTRLAAGPDGRIYASDAGADAVFVYDSDLQLIGEIKGLARPLGVAIDAQGNVFVGSDGRDNVEVYDAFGVLRRVIDDGAIGMPTDLVIDSEQRLYVADSQSNTVKVYDASGTWVRNIGQPGDGQGQMRFPAALALAEVGELYVADQGHSKVAVFDLEGGFLRAYGGPAPAFSSRWQGLFVRLQSLALDAGGRLHAADSNMNRVQILNASTGAYIDSYGEFGTELGQLNVPLDILITATGRVVVANAENHRIEVIYTVP